MLIRLPIRRPAVMQVILLMSSRGVFSITSMLTMLDLHRAAASEAATMLLCLGEAATETAIKAMSADDRLARARVVHFATHGLVAGEVKRLAEPALVHATC
jgi:hypothetical protein